MTEQKMTPAEHYAEAERLLAHAEAEIRSLPPVHAGVPAEVEQMRVNLALHAASIATAQVHATLATAKIERFHGPVVVSAPSEVIDQIKIIDPSDHSAGILFIPEEMDLGPDHPPLVEQLLERMREPIDPEARP